MDQRKIRPPDEILAGLEEAAASDDGPLPPQTQIEIDERMLGKRYVGSFTFEVPTLADMIRVGRLKAEYLPNGAAADPSALLLVEQVCYLAVTLKKSPPWWKPFDFRSGDVVAKVYGEAVAYANSFLGRDKNDAGAAPEDTAENPGGGGAGDAGDVVPDVQPADQRRKTVLAHSSRSERGDSAAGGDH